jgi:diacylglycerol kinase (ATP)
MKEIPKKRTGVTRLFFALKYTFEGLKQAVLHEAAFRQEFIFAIISLPVMFFLEMPGIIRLLIFFATMFVMVTELLNTGLEAIVDKVSPEFHILAKQAKDMGSAAVFLSLITLAIVWGYGIYLIIL